jgi:hypothetical protein
VDPSSRARLQAVQARIDAALQESIEDSARSTFSSYLPGASTQVQAQLWRQPATGEIDDLERILDRFDELGSSEDPGRLRHALSVVLTHHPTVAALGLQLPPLEQRSLWKVVPPSVGS